MSQLWRGRSPIFNLSLWSFCLRSVFKEYGKTFLLKVVVPHPMKTLKGVRNYAQFSARNPSTGSTLIPKESEPLWAGGKGSVVGIGFCAKPLEPSCISGRANHNCAYFENHLHLSKDPVPKPCQNCLVREVGSMALSSKSNFYIMTSAGGMLSNILFGKLAIVGYVVTGWGDAVGEPAGTRWGKHKYRVPTLTGIQCYRSLEGSLAVFVASLIGSFIVLYFGFHLPVDTGLIAALSVAVIAMLIEAITFHSLDNLTLQVAATATALYILKLLGSF